MSEMLHQGLASALVTPAQIDLDAKLSRSYAALANEAPAAVRVGSVLIQEGLLLPEGWALEVDRYAVGWGAVTTLDGFALDGRVRSAGWNFFLIAGEIKAMALGSGNKTVRKAVTRLLAVVRSRRFNAAEVAAIASGRFVGIPYTAVTVHARHIQQSNVLQNADARKKVQWLAGWAGSPAGARSRRESA